MHIRHYTVALLLCLLAFNIQAADAVNSPDQGSSWLYIEHGNGLVTNIPVAGNQALFGSVMRLSKSLSDRKEQLSEAVKKNEFTKEDVLITAIMPGGLIYASYKKLSHNLAKKELVEVTSRIEELTMDMVRLADIDNDARVAMLY
jgi:hypothetical protein